jgi:AcrR family transcriptional regulator
MKEICSAADRSPGSVYRYFPAKEDIITALIEADRRRWETLLEQVPLERGLIPALRSLAEVGLQDLKTQGFLSLWVETCAEAARNPKVALTLRRSYDSFEQRLAQLITESQKRRMVNASLNPVDTARMILATFDGLILRKCFDGDLDTSVTVAAFLGFLEPLLDPPRNTPTHRA